MHLRNYYTILTNIIDKTNKAIMKHCVQMDVFPLIAVLINIVFVIVYLNEYPLLNQAILLLVAFIVFGFVLASVIVYLLMPKIRYKLFPIIWFIAVFLALGFLPSYAVFITNGKKYLVLNLSSSLLLLSIVVNWLFFVSISVVGLLSGYIFFLFTGFYDVNFTHSSKKLYALSYLISFMFLSIALFMRSKEKIQAKKFDFMEVFSGAIAHEVNGPLAAIKMLSESLNMILIDIEVRKTDGKKVHVTLDEMDYQMLTQTINPGLKQSSNDALQIVEMLLTALRDRYTKQYSYHKVTSIVDDAVKMAAHLNHVGKNITCSVNDDFEIYCSQQLMKHVIYNILKNAIKHGGYNINICIDKKTKTIAIRDNGVGIDEASIEKVFDSFYTKGNGSGIGLAFCKFVMDEIKGQITCNSQQGEYTEFTLHFKDQQELITEQDAT